MQHMIRRSLQKAMRTPAYATGETLLLLFAGLYGSLYATEIRSASPFGVRLGPIECHAALFWGTAAVALLMFWSRRRAQDEDRTRAEARLDDRAAQFERLIRTLPPDDFLSAFSEVHMDCSDTLGQVWRANPEELTSQTLTHAIQVVLASVASLARSFDGRPIGATYSANLMIYRPIEEIRFEDVASLRARLRFSDSGVDTSRLAGVLDLRCDLSATLARKAVYPDPGLQPLALPIPREIKSPDGLRSRVLPGAPQAFCGKPLDGYADTSTLGDWCRRAGEFSESVAQDVESYFSGSVRSFISLPIRFVGGEHPVAVLNIHCDRPSMLKGTGTIADPVNQFSVLAVTCQTTLAFLLERLYSIES